MRRFPISHDRWFAVLSTMILISPSRSFVTVGPDQVEVHMGWGFRSVFPRSAVANASRDDDSRPISRGAHGWAGRWLVNGKAAPLVHIDLEPRQRGSVLGYPLHLRRISVSCDSPDELVEALRG